MTYDVRLTTGARDRLRATDREQALRILSKLTDLLADPYAPDTTALPGSFESERRLPVGDHRVVYTVHDRRRQVHVVHIRRRDEVHRCG
ncbi:type II toxin-antitoxin system RelE family toxin [Streptomyces megasporus]|uniref:type II toxin-antitoxin system RelE family toxin n=1 Tax=Streptomyces megasporus TaxID=44060 RepID=UPI0004E0C6AE|nr:type II toxin-antitoxin system RelE/ParE family toxin [Streptomyces megasporus]